MVLISTSTSEKKTSDDAVSSLRISSPSPCITTWGTECPLPYFRSNFAHARLFSGSSPARRAGTCFVGQGCEADRRRSEPSCDVIETALGPTITKAWYSKPPAVYRIPGPWVREFQVRFVCREGSLRRFNPPSPSLIPGTHSPQYSMAKMSNQQVSFNPETYSPYLDSPCIEKIVMFQSERGMNHANDGALTHGLLLRWVGACSTDQSLRVVCDNGPLCRQMKGL